MRLDLPGFGCPTERLFGIPLRERPAPPAAVDPAGAIEDLILRLCPGWHGRFVEGVDWGLGGGCWLEAHRAWHRLGCHLQGRPRLCWHPQGGARL